jgi:hypothetical protein
MRLAGQLKGGFYPAPADAVAMAASRLKIVTKETAILDPCCGKGAALHDFGTLLKLPSNRWCAVELEPHRGKESKEKLEGARVVQPCDFLSMRITSESFGFIWCNPPYDDEIGGGMRVEYSFLSRCTQLLVDNGIIALACPERLRGNMEICRHMLSHYHDLAWERYPTQQFNEIIIWGRKRSRPVEVELYSAKHQFERAASTTPGTYEVPAAFGPKRFDKVAMTPAEALEAMRASKLSQIFKAKPTLGFQPPPLELGKGQMGLVLAGGFLNTTLKLPGEAPILIKATPGKETYLKETTVEEGEKENTVKQVYSERIKMKVRVVDGTGAIYDLQ